MFSVVWQSGLQHYFEYRRKTPFSSLHHGSQLLSPFELCAIESSRQLRSECTTQQCSQLPCGMELVNRSRGRIFCHFCLKTVFIESNAPGET